MGLAVSRGVNPRAVPALLELHAHALQRFVGDEPVAVGDPFWCVLSRVSRRCCVHQSDRAALRRARREELLAFPDVLTRLRPQDVERHLHPSCAALGASDVPQSRAHRTR